MALDCLKSLAKDSSGDFFNGSQTYAVVEWPHHLILGLQEQERIWDEAIMNTLIDVIENFLTFQGKKWFNTLCCAMNDLEIVWLGDEVKLCQVSHNSSFDCFTVNL